MTHSRPTRRGFVKLAAAAGLSTVAPWDRLAAGAWGAPAAGKKPRLVKYPEKVDMVMLTDRPPNLETPLKYFKEDLTPNEAFFVRWHVSGIPTTVDTGTFRIAVTGNVSTELSLSLDDLKKFEPASVVAVCQCSGNSRGYFEPGVNGVEWSNAACGNAKWTGARLKDILAKAGMKDGTIEVAVQGLDRPPLTTTPKFVKTVPIAKASDPDTIVAYQMNGKDIPMLNGFPCRLIVPGWYGTYWMKAINDIRVCNEHFKTFWMDKAYRIPNNPTANETPKELATDTVPISVMNVRSLFVTPSPGADLSAGEEVKVSGIAFDQGTGIKSVDVSTDGGKTWAAATLGPDLGKYSFRRWTLAWTPKDKGDVKLMARATNNAGDVQPATANWNRSGYKRNIIETLAVTVS